MSYRTLVHFFALSLPAILIAGCISIPIPANEETVVFGRAIAAEEARAINLAVEGPLEVRTKLGTPTLDFGPQRIYVYVWVVSRGSAIPLGMEIASTVPWLVTQLLVVAFDSYGMVLKSATRELSQWDTVSEHVRGWLSSEGLATRVSGPRPSESARGERMLFVYRPSPSDCPERAVELDGLFFKPSVAVDGHVVGDLAKGEYLSSSIRSGAHEIAIDPMPVFRAAGAGKASQQLSRELAPMALNIGAEHTGDVYIQASVCRRSGMIYVNATVPQSAVALQALDSLRSAW